MAVYNEKAAYRARLLVEDINISPGIQRALWKTDESEGAETAERFISRALAQREGRGISGAR
jgi:hypothetical protein